jgi:hypothetical protein
MSKWNSAYNSCHFRQRLYRLPVQTDIHLPRTAQMALFNRYIGIDYSGAKTADSSLSGLRVYMASSSNPPKEEMPPPSPRKYWTRRGVAHWLCNELSKDIPSIIGIDHGFSFPVAFFDKCCLPHDWSEFLDDFQRHWPTDGHSTCIDFIRDGNCGRGYLRTGDPTWMRLTEQWTATAKSVFLFDVQGSVAKSTHAGLPWLRYLQQQCQRKIHFWPFDGWDIPPGCSVVAEVYPSLWMKRFPREDRDNDQQAAYTVAAWLKRADTSGSLVQFFNPPLMPQERDLASIEGWILGVV